MLNCVLKFSPSTGTESAPSTAHQRVLKEGLIQFCFYFLFKEMWLVGLFLPSRTIHRKSGLRIRRKKKIWIHKAPMGCIYRTNASREDDICQTVPSDKQRTYFNACWPVLHEQRTNMSWVGHKFPSVPIPIHSPLKLLSLIVKHFHVCLKDYLHAQKSSS